MSRCRSGSLRVTYAGETAVAGHAAAWFEFTNTGLTPCTLFGYPGMQLLGGVHQPLPTHVQRMPAPEHAVTLSPGRRGTFETMWVPFCVGNCPSIHSGIVHSYYLRITAPNDYGSHVVNAAAMTHVQGGAIQVWPVCPSRTCLARGLP
ncbi:MAG: DUF4232 domain-containing protein [Acidimicrobiales bacterium]